MKDLVPLGRSAREPGNQTAPHSPGSARNLASAGLSASTPDKERDNMRTRREHEGHTEDKIMTSTKEKKVKVAERINMIQK